MSHAEISSPTLLLEGNETNLYYFYPLLQQGVMIKTQIGCSIRDMLCKLPGISPDYIEARIKTIFLDGKPVDDPDSAMIKDGSVVALSAAMPGLVGATLRRGGHLALFRNAITHQKDEIQPVQNQDGVVLLKLFNLLVRELGPGLLKQGVWINGETLESFLNDLPEDFWTLCKEPKLNNKVTDVNHLGEKNMFDRQELVLILVKDLGDENERKDF